MFKLLIIAVFALALSTVLCYGEEEGESCTNFGEEFEVKFECGCCETDPPAICCDDDSCEEDCKGECTETRICGEEGTSFDWKNADAESLAKFFEDSKSEGNEFNIGDCGSADNSANCIENLKTALKNVYNLPDGADINFGSGTDDKISIKDGVITSIRGDPAPNPPLTFDLNQFKSASIENLKISVLDNGGIELELTGADGIDIKGRKISGNGKIVMNSDNTVSIGSESEIDIIYGGKELTIATGSDANSKCSYHPADFIEGEDRDFIDCENSGLTLKEDPDDGSSVSLTFDEKTNVFFDEGDLPAGKKGIAIGIGDSNKIRVRGVNGVSITSANTNEKSFTLTANGMGDNDEFSISDSIYAGDSENPLDFDADFFNLGDSNVVLTSDSANIAVRNTEANGGQHLYFNSRTEGDSSFSYDLKNNIIKAKKMNIGLSTTYGDDEFPEGRSTEQQNNLLIRDDDEVSVYLNQDMPAGADKSISFYYCGSKGDFNCDDIEKRGFSINNVNAMISYLSYENEKKGRLGIITEDMNSGENVECFMNDDGEFDIDLDGSGDSTISILTGMQGVTYIGDPPDELDRHNMWACNPITGSCPFDEESELVLNVRWIDDKGESHEIIIYAQEKIEGSNFSTCICDLSVGCDGDCPCDLTCKFQGEPDWVWQLFGYSNYLNSRGFSGICKNDAECVNRYGSKGYHIYNNGVIVDPNDYFGASYYPKAAVYDHNGKLLDDELCGDKIFAFPHLFRRCLGIQTNDLICPKSCSSQGQCSEKCLNDCAYSNGNCYLYFDDLTKIITLESISGCDEIKIDITADKHCRYCNEYPRMDTTKKISISSGPVPDQINTLFSRFIINLNNLTINLSDYTIDEYSESAEYEIISNSYDFLDCRISKGNNPHDCSSGNGQYLPYQLVCNMSYNSSIHNDMFDNSCLVATDDNNKSAYVPCSIMNGQIEIKVTDEGGLNNRNDATLKHDFLGITISFINTSYLMTSITCPRECTGKVCGGDGCGGSCGTCDSGEMCLNGVCVINETICNNAQDGGLCAGLNVTYWQGYKESCCSEFGKCCFCDQEGDTLDCTMTYGDCEATGTKTCNANGYYGECSAVDPRIDTCVGKGCADDDNCGGKCVTCPEGQTCDDQTNQCKTACVPICAEKGKECGDDGCGNDVGCGTCSVEGEECIEDYNYRGIVTDGKCCKLNDHFDCEPGTVWGKSVVWYDGCGNSRGASGYPYPNDPNNYLYKSLSAAQGYGCMARGYTGAGPYAFNVIEEFSTCGDPVVAGVPGTLHNDLCYGSLNNEFYGRPGSYCKRGTCTTVCEKALANGCDKDGTITADHTWKYVDSSCPDCSCPRAGDEGYGKLCRTCLSSNNCATCESTYPNDWCQPIIGCCDSYSCIELNCVSMS